MKYDDCLGKIYVFNNKYYIYLGILKGYDGKTKHYSMELLNKNVSEIQDLKDHLFGKFSIVYLPKKVRERLPALEQYNKLNFSEDYIDEFHNMVCEKIKYNYFTFNNDRNLQSSYYLQKENSKDKYMKYGDFLNELQKLKIFK